MKLSGALSGEVAAALSAGHCSGQRVPAQRGFELNFMAVAVAALPLFGPGNRIPGDGCIRHHVTAWSFVVNLEIVAVLGDCEGLRATAATMPATFTFASL